MKNWSTAFWLKTHYFHTKIPHQKPSVLNNVPCAFIFLPTLRARSSFYVPCVPSFFEVPYVLYVPHLFRCLTCLHFSICLARLQFFKVFSSFDMPLLFYTKCGTTHNQLQQAAGISKNEVQKPKID